MRVRPSIRSAAAIAVLATCLAPSAARAQSAGDRDARVRQIIRGGMDAYQNLEIDRAADAMREAVRTCGRRHCSPRVLAELNMAIGVVELGGRNDVESAVQAFTDALLTDPSITVDPTLVTPEIAAAFQRARRATRGAANVRPLTHTPPAEQLAHVPLPVYAETGINGAVHVDLYYRPRGTQMAFVHVAMERVGRGWGAEIPCTVIAGAGVEYYVSAFDDHETVFAQAGDEDAPLQVAVVSERTGPAPSLPGRLPPERCESGALAEAPHDLAAGAACVSTAECRTGLVCNRGVCGAPERDDPRHRTWFEADLGVGVGLSFRGGQPSYDEAEPVTPGDPSIARCPDGTVDGQAPVYCARNPTGVGVAPFVSLNLRANVLRWLGVAGTIRFQPDAGPRTILSNVQLGLRGYFAVTRNGFVAQGPIVAPFVGTAVGQIQTTSSRPSDVPDTVRPGHLITGLNDVHGGVRLEVGIKYGIRLGAEAAYHHLFPRVSDVLDFSAFFGWQY